LGKATEDEGKTRRNEYVFGRSEVKVFRVAKERGDERKNDNFLLVQKNRTSSIYIPYILESNPHPNLIRT
jgi:hypothetical protein